MSDQHTSNQNPSALSSSPEILDPDRHRPHGFPVWTAVAILIVTGIVLSVIVGVLQRGGLDRLEEVVGLGSQIQSVTLVESNNAMFVMSTSRDGHDEIRLMNVRTHQIEDVSRGAEHATQPALSHSGEQIAHFTLRNEKLDLDVAMVGGNSLILIPSGGLLTLGTQKALADLQACSWSRIWWSRSDTYLAFFACTDSASLVAVKDLVQGEFFVLDSTYADTQAPRTLLWLSDNELAVVQPEGSFDTVWLIDVASGQKQQVFGP
jgi:hypothetical protein